MFGRGKEYDFQGADEKLTAETGKGLCLTYCKGACCRDMTFFNLPEEEFKILSESASKVERVQTPGKAIDIATGQLNLGDGLFYSINPDGNYTVGLSGACPNLKADNSCGVYVQRPQACRDFGLGDSSCKSARKKSNIIPLEQVIPKEFVQTKTHSPIPFIRRNSSDRTS